MKKVTHFVYFTWFCLVICSSANVMSQIPHIDVKQYRFDLRVSDAHDTIHMKETIDFSWKDKNKIPCLNLVSKKKNGKGMQVNRVTQNGKDCLFLHQQDTLYFTDLPYQESPITIEITYSGIPADGLVIGKNKYGNRTFFGDNWPTRARNWMACNDHLSDKAKVLFSVQAPAHYQVIANGIHQSTISLSEKEKNWNYFSDIELPMKVVVVGIADFEVKWNKEKRVSSWVYPENKEGGFYDFDLAPSIVTFFENYIAPYEFSTLANVQSTTRFGGMENAGCIFYDENAIDGTRSCEALLAHEIAHQWFGNSATESDWPHLWLSEGFATYLTLLYQEKVKGKEVFLEELKQDRKQISAFVKSYPNPVIDLTQRDLMKLLNANSYQKGSGVLHMLRVKVGDAVFQKILQTYYGEYRLTNATSTDFERIAEKISGLELTQFFNQWLRKPGIPRLSIQSTSKRNHMDLTLLQNQKNISFQFPMQLKILFKDGTSVIETIDVKGQATHFKKTYTKKVSSFEVDPNTELLFEQLD
jgi:aminopeptidase N